MNNILNLIIIGVVLSVCIISMVCAWIFVPTVLSLFFISISIIFGILFKWLEFEWLKKKKIEKYDEKGSFTVSATMHEDVINNNPGITASVPSLHIMNIPPPPPPPSPNSDKDLIEEGYEPDIDDFDDNEPTTRFDLMDLEDE